MATQVSTAMVSWFEIRLTKPLSGGFPGGSVSKESSCNDGNPGLFPGLGIAHG